MHPEKERAKWGVLNLSIEEVETKDLATDLNTRGRRLKKRKATNLPKQEEFVDVGLSSNAWREVGLIVIRFLCLWKN